MVDTDVEDQEARDDFVKTEVAGHYRDLNAVVVVGYFACNETAAVIFLVRVHIRDQKIGGHVNNDVVDCLCYFARCHERKKMPLKT